LAACADLRSADGDLAPIDLGPPGAPVVRLLDRLDSARFQLPAAPPLPPDLRLTGPWEETAPGRWSTPSPIDLPFPRYNGEPPGVWLERDGARVPYGPWLTRGEGSGWAIAGGRITVSSEGQPTALVLHDDASAAASERLQATWTDPAGHGRQVIRRDGRSRDALLLPVGGSVTWSLDPEPGRLLRLAVASAPVAGAEDAVVELTIHAGGARLWQETVGGGWTEIRAPLPDRAREIQVTLGAGAPAGWLALATPEIVGAAGEGPRRVVAIAVDTLRPDHLATHGYPRTTTPALDAFAREAVVFENARAPAPRTRPSMQAALTGREPHRSGGTLGAALQRGGFTTAGIVANVHLSEAFGFARGYGDWTLDDAADAGEQVDRALRWLSGHATEDTFLLLHLMDPHTFYLAPEPHRDRFTGGAGLLPDRYNRWMVARWAAQGLTDAQRDWIRGRYDGELAYMDAEIARLLAGLEALPGQTLTAVFSDHGEEFWEHGGFEHNHSLYDEVVRALLWLRAPGGWSGGPHRRAAAVSLIDLAPTLLAAAGITPPDDMDGASLLPLLAEDPALEQQLEARPLLLGHHMFGVERWGVVADGHKYILETMSGAESLYRLADDPGEQTDRSGADPQTLAAMRAALGRASGWPVGVGWRFDIEGLTAPLELRFPEEVSAAGVLDPESGRTRRAIREWGEAPDSTPADVARVEVSADGRTVRIEPGGASGTVAVVGPTASSHAQIVGDTSQTLTPGAHQPEQGGLLTARPGAIILPRGLTGSAALDPHDRTHLEALGYLQPAPAHTPVR